MRYSIFALLLLSRFTIAAAQSLIPSIQSEVTIRGMEYGATMIYESKKKLGYGIFYQARWGRNQGYDNRYVLYGLHFQLPIVHVDRLSLFATGRAGLVNEKFVVALPGFETRIDLLKRYALSLGGSMRMGYPSLVFKLSVKLNAHGTD